MNGPGPTPADGRASARTTTGPAAALPIPAAPQVNLRVPAALNGERVDRGLALLTGLTRAQASRLVAGGGVRVGGRTVTVGSRRLSGGELLEADVTGDEASSGPGPELAQDPGGEASPVWVPEATVVYVDDQLVVVDKPAGLVVHPGAGNAQGTLVQQLVGRFPDIADAGPDHQRPGIVHRIDKGTSGLLVVARTEAAREHLSAQLSARSMTRGYLTVVHGEMEADEGVVDAPLGRSQLHRVKIAVVEGGREARTRYYVQARSPGPMPASLLVCRLDTGRTHQIRVHLAAIGHAVVGDERYAKPSFLRAARQTLPELRRPWLHAAQLGFAHPTTGEAMSFSSPVPADLAEAASVLGLGLGTVGGL